MSVQVKRAYEPPAPGDGYRVLVDRLWPRGVSKEKLKMNEWMKEIAPSTELRKWYGHEAGKWAAFRERYRRELSKPPASEYLESLVRRARNGRVTLLTGARDAERSDGAVIAELIRESL